jgi:hypothetical protein
MPIRSQQSDKLGRPPLRGRPSTVGAGGTTGDLVVDSRSHWKLGEDIDNPLRRWLSGKPSLAQLVAAAIHIDLAGSPAGEPLPTVGRLMAHYAVGQGTIQRALRLLEQEGLINKGRGEWVTTDAPAQLAEIRRVTGTRAGRSAERETG